MEAPKIKVAIIDDELHCVKTLSYQIEKQFNDIEILFGVTDCSQAKLLVEQQEPDIIFLDIEMPGMNGLQFLDHFEKIPFKVIFITAYNQYAIRAIKLNAFDYLLKPIDKNELEQSIQKFRKERDKSFKEQVKQLHLFAGRKIKDTIALSSAPGLYFAKISDIIYLEGNSCYTHVVMNDGKTHVISKTLANFDDILTEEHNFFRAHKSYIINLRYVQNYIRGEGGEIIMTDNKRIVLSRNRKEDFLKLFIKV